MFKTCLRADAGLEENSAQKQYKNLTWFLRWAIRKGYTQVCDAIGLMEKMFDAK